MILFECLYCSLIYRNKKVKSYQEGFLSQVGSKVNLLNDQKVGIDSCFSKKSLAADEEFEMSLYYVVCQEQMSENAKNSSQNSPPNSNSNVSANKNRRISDGLKNSLKRKPLHTTIVIKQPKLMPDKSATKSNYQESATKSNIPSHKAIPMEAPMKKPISTKNTYGLTFEANSHDYRLCTIPNSFANETLYQKCMIECISELINLQLGQVAKRLAENMRKVPVGNNPEWQLRKNHISMHSGKLEKYHPNEWTIDTTDSAQRSDNVILKLNDKEHSSKYSKDDIWVVSTSSKFDSYELFLSWHYGPNKNAVELIPLAKSKEYERFFNVGPKLKAIRAINCSSEMACLQILSNLEASPLIPYLSKGTITDNSIDLEHHPDCKFYLLKITELISIEYSLNSEQKEVLIQFARALCGESNPVVLVHGVYGAGKSLILSILIIVISRAKNCGLLKEDTRIVLSSLTNVAVDRVLQNLLELGFSDFVRIGSIKKIAKSVLPYTCQHQSDARGIKELQEMLENEEMSVTDRQFVEQTIKIYQNQENRKLICEAFVIGTTVLASTFGLVDDTSVPILILDECSQMTEPMSLLPICRFKSRLALLVGDPKQLAPTLLNDKHPRLNGFGIERTLFERLATLDNIPILLKKQYRCHPHISLLSNRSFYNNELLNGLSDSKRPPIISNLGPVSFVLLRGNEKKTAASYTNEVEAKFIVSLVSKLIQRSVSQSDIGVISLYKPQAKLIETNLKTEGISTISATVDSFQGAENQIIILATTRTKATEFLDEPRRVNVAITRAKSHLIIVASDLMVRSSSLWSRIQGLCKSVKPGVIPPEELLEILQ